MAQADPPTITALAQQLVCIANDLRAAGDVPLVVLGREGIGPAAITLADELWLVAVQLDDAMFEWRAGGPDGPPDESAHHLGVDE